MASIATIQIAEDRLKVDGGTEGSFSFTITNVFGSDMDMGGSIVETDDNIKSWFTVAAPVEREVKDQATDTFVVKVNVPKDAKPGEYKFSFLLYSTENPNIDFSQSDPVVIVVPEAATEPKPAGFKMKWWMWLIIGVVVLGIIGGIIAIVISGSDKPEKTEDPCEKHWTERPLSCGL